jgi:arylsulfatase A-like enzyme
MRGGLHRLTALAVIGLGGCGIMGDPAVEEAVEMASMGGQRPLREPLRPLRGGTRVLVFAMDGVGWDDLAAALRDGTMPNLAALLGRDLGDGAYESAYLTRMLTVLPSATTPAWATVFTGQPPAMTGVPGNEWFDRSSMRYYAPVPITVDSRAHAAKLYGDELMSDLLRSETLYERTDVRTHIAFHPVFRGADLLTLPTVTAFGDLAGAIAGGLVTRGSVQTAKVFEETDLTNVKNMIDALGDEGVPDLQVVYFPGIDLQTHREEDPIAGQQRYLARVTDRAIGEVLEAYREMGVLDSTYVLFVSDHGHIARINDDLHSLHVGDAAEPPAVLAETGFRLRPDSLEPERTDFQAAVAFQGGLGYVYLADRSTCPEPGSRCDWSRAPRMEEDVLPVARAFHRAGREPGRAGGLHGALDLVLARATGTAGDAPPFRVFDGERLVPLGEYLAANPRPDLVDLERRLDWLAVGPYGHLAGDVLLIARSSPDLPVEQRYYFGPPYWSEHGSPHMQDSSVPLILAHPGRPGAELRGLLERHMDAAPTQLGVAGLILALLGGA